MYCCWCFSYYSCCCCWVFPLLAIVHVVGYKRYWMWGTEFLFFCTFSVLFKMNITTTWYYILCVFISLWGTLLSEGWWFSLFYANKTFFYGYYIDYDQQHFINAVLLNFDLCSRTNVVHFSMFCLYGVIRNIIIYI